MKRYLAEFFRKVKESIDCGNLSEPDRRCDILCSAFFLLKGLALINPLAAVRGRNLVLLSDFLRVNL